VIIGLEEHPETSFAAAAGRAGNPMATKTEQDRRL